MITKFIYSLGGACWVHDDIPKDMRQDSFFKGAAAIDSSFFTPLLLFNKKLRDDIYFDFDNWQIRKTKVWDQFKEKYIFDAIFDNVKGNLTLHHINSRKNAPHNIDYANLLFEEFEKNKYFQFFIIDFQRGHYNLFKNEQLLEFELFLKQHNFNYNNFVYLDVSNAQITNRFEKCKIPVFIQDVNDQLGFGHPYDKNSFRNTRCFFAKQKTYIDEQVNRIKNEYLQSMQ